MFGQNAKRPRDKTDGTLLQVHEIWYTVQGEGPFAGMPAVFVRLSGCNVACFFCDTKWDDEHDPERHVDDVVREILNKKPASCRLVVLTGGEPTRQSLGPLIERLLDMGIQVQLESNGLFYQTCLERQGVTVVVSPKTAKIHPEMYRRADAFKYVIRRGETSLDDGLPDFSTQTEGAGAPLQRPRPGAEVFISPCDEQDDTVNKANHLAVGEIAMKYGYRVSLQQHKYIGTP